MSKVLVSLINLTDNDVSVGVGTTRTTAIAGKATVAELVDTSADAYGFLVAGVALIPENVTVEALAEFADDEPADDEFADEAGPDISGTEPDG